MGHWFGDDDYYVHSTYPKIRSYRSCQTDAIIVTSGATADVRGTANSRLGKVWWRTLLKFRA